MKTKSGMDWYPAGTRWRHGRPEVGMIIALEFAAWEVEHVQDAILTEEEERLVLGFRESVRHERMPYQMTLNLLHGPEFPGIGEAIALRVEPMSYTVHEYPGGRVPICSCCGEPYPCRSALAEEAAAAAAAAAEQAEQTAAASGCQACGEPIRARQGSIVYPEPDVRVVLGSQPRFHTRRRCAQGRASYEKTRQAAIGPVPRIVDTFGYVIASQESLGTFLAASHSQEESQ